ncbi:MAG TPA: hypothetical protein VLY63_18520, partial [Anaerolineae bacterium]|nr:hypothetical protein [Anaerolineae bacterium]
MNLAKRRFLSILVIVLGLIMLLLAVRALAPKAGPELPPVAEGRSHNLLSGTVAGLDAGDRVRLELDRGSEDGGG